MSIENLKSVIDYGIIGLLTLMSILTISLAIERFLFFRRLDLRNYPNRKMLELDLSKNLGTIATVGSSPPYIGLLGTVMAIILTFYVIGEQKGDIDTGEIMKHLALALKATAVGLLVAIPATIFYNMLMDKVDRLLIRWDILYDKE